MDKVPREHETVFFAYVEVRDTQSIGFVNEQHRVGSTSFWALPFIEI